MNIGLPKQEIIRQINALVTEYVSTDQLTKNLVVAIDITCEPDLIAEGIAGQLAQAILSSLDQYYPNLRDRFVGISDDEARLPLHELMRTGKLAYEEIDNQHLFVFE